MKRLNNNPAAMICILGCFGAATFIALATVHADAVDTIQACYNNTNGELRRVTSAADCHKHETPISWSIAGPAGPAGPPGPAGPVGPQGPPGSSGAAGETFRQTHTAANECTGPSAATYSVLDRASTNGNAVAKIFVTAIIGINAARTNTNPNSNLLLIYTGGSPFGTCPAGHWLIGGGDITVGAQFNVMVVGP